ncbi:hypothetical protein LWI28_011950 [Acer negundo]|uniref:Uncharacterized protein n=1 Tax=Acer negundo TaxID=4023 RepID=A0AAD5NUE9_ACENE|nr:hypothetical protein LWI28_011950 [Acer negundo]
MKVAVDENDLKAVGAQPLPVGRRGLRIHDWEVKSHKGGRRSWTRRICRRWYSKEGLPSIEVLAAAQWKFRRFLWYLKISVHVALIRPQLLPLKEKLLC